MAVPDTWDYGTVRRGCTTGARVTRSVRGRAGVALGPGISDCTIGNVRRITSTLWIGPQILRPEAGGEDTEGTLSRPSRTVEG